MYMVLICCLIMENSTYSYKTGILTQIQDIEGSWMTCHYAILFGCEVSKPILIYMKEPFGIPILDHSMIVYMIAVISLLHPLDRGIGALI